MSSNSIEFGGPYVQLATFCQTAFPDPQGNLSVIRIIDRYQVIGPTEEMVPSQVQLTLAVILKSGSLSQQSKVTFQPVAPSGKRLPQLQWNVLFEGQERGVVITIPIGMMLDEQGLYWCEIAVEGMVLTKIPLRILYQQVRSGITPGTLPER